MLRFAIVSFLIVLDATRRLRLPMPPLSHWYLRSVVEGQICLGNHRKAFRVERLHRQIGIVDHQSDGGVAMRSDDQRVGLNDVDLRSQQRSADLQERLRAVREFDPDQVRLDHGQAGTLQDLSPLFRVAEQKANEGTFGGIVNGQSNDADFTPLKSSYDLEQLADAVLQKHGELANRRVISPTNRREIKAGAFANTHTRRL